MSNQELRNNLQNLLHESYEFSVEDRKLILKVIDDLENVCGKEQTPEDLAEKCKSVYMILRGKAPFKEFVQILKSEKKMGAFSNTLY